MPRRRRRSTDLDRGTGFQIFGFTGGAEYNVEIASDGSAALYTGGAGQTFVADLDVRMNADGTVAVGSTTERDFTDPTATDNCDGSVIPSYVVTEGGIPVSLGNGDVWPVGDYVVTYSATDDRDNTSFDFFIVTVNDNEAPVLSTMPDATNPRNHSAITRPVVPTMNGLG